MQQPTPSNALTAVGPPSARRDPPLGASTPERPALIDRLGVVASTACAVHCASVAVLPSLFAAVGLSALLGHEAEWGFTLLAAGLATFALVSNWRRHGALKPVLAFAVGIAGLFAARFLEEAGAHEIGTAIAVCSGAALVLGHILNLRLRRAVAEPENDATCCAPE